MDKDEILDIANRLTEYANKLQGTDYVELPDGGLSCRVEHWGVKHLVASLLKTFEEGGGPPNYLVMVVGTPESKKVEVTLRPLDGYRRTPAMDVVAMKHKVEELEAQLAEAKTLRCKIRRDDPSDCDHDWKPIQNFYCYVVGRRCHKCKKEESVA